MKTYDQILEEIAQIESRIKEVRKEIKECSDIFAHDMKIQIFATILKELTVKLQTLNWVINQ